MVEKFKCHQGTEPLKTKFSLGQARVIIKKIFSDSVPIQTVGKNGSQTGLQQDYIQVT